MWNLFGSLIAKTLFDTPVLVWWIPKIFATQNDLFYRAVPLDKGLR